MKLNNNCLCVYSSIHLALLITHKEVTMNKPSQAAINKENARINREKRIAKRLIDAKAVLALAKKRDKVINDNADRLIRIKAARTQLKADITAGMEIFKELHKGKDINISISNPELAEKRNSEALTNYQLQKLGDLTGKCIDTISASGGITLKTLISIGVGVGYTGSPLSIVGKVLRDMAGK